MKTDDLVSMLALQVAPVPRHAATHRLVLALMVGVPLSATFMAIAFGVRHDLLEALFLPMFWVKVIFPLAVAAAGFVAAQRLARPGVRVGGAFPAILAPVLAVWVLATIAWSAAPADARAAMLWGQTWRACAISIFVLALPVFVGAMCALKSLGPTRPRLAGAAAGALAGGAGAAVYALHCPELTAPFLAVWYVSGMTLPVVVGALMGPRFLRW